ncbi:MAG: glycosyltransferase [Thermomicrobiaceae bacterium]
MLNQVDIATELLDDYLPLIHEEQADELRDLARRLQGQRILHLNATPYGGGVSELLRSALALQRGLGLDVDWRVIGGETTFFEVTKRFHNALQGAEYGLPDEDRETYLLQNNFNANEFENDYDLVVVHDPQPVPLLQMHGRGSAKWVWRCHIDTSEPNERVLTFLKPYIDEYDALIFTLDKFVPDALRNHRIALIPPGIDPLSPKNFDLTPEQCRRIMSWVGVDTNKPVMTQVSRFDPWKDPLGVIRVFREARKQVPDLQLALLGSMAMDDPEAWDLMAEIRSEAEGDDSILVATNLTGIGNMEVNVFQRASDVVVQKSIREGFGLIVSETLWKGTAMVAGNTGGIPIQMPEGTGGFLVDPHDESMMAERVIELINNPELRKRLGDAGREVVREKFLITRYVVDELRLLADLVD